jgi:frataxin-like iron-binding protein CyaY
MNIAESEFFKEADRVLQELYDNIDETTGDL